MVSTLIYERNFINGMLPIENFDDFFFRSIRLIFRALPKQ